MTDAQFNEMMTLLKSIDAKLSERGPTTIIRETVREVRPLLDSRTAHRSGCYCPDCSRVRQSGLR